ncbi:hypothetical protein [Deinococcus roseus]|uniref:hypothetical protein n=1 Tax=Deinococcus roseus TaxID=392414 RepID=UPI001667056E|nr:hypothetical protein [Deinococcus roseus]
MLYSLADHWIVKENVRIGYVEENFLLISSYGVYAIFPQEVQGQFAMTPRGFTVDGQHQTPVVQSIQESIKQFERRLGIKVQPIILYKELQQESRNITLGPPRQEWESGELVILTWEGLKPYLHSRVRWFLNWPDLMKLCKRLKELY